MKKILSLGVVLIISVLSLGQPPDVTIFVNGDIGTSYTTAPTLGTINGADVVELMTTDVLDSTMVIPDCTDTLSIMHSGGYFSINSAGLYEVWVVDCSSTIAYFKINVSEPSSSSIAEDDVDNKDLIIYPSPATSATTVRFYADKSDVPIYIYSLDGKAVLLNTTPRKVGSLNEVEIDLSHFEKGIYLVKAGRLVEKLFVE